MPPLRFALRAHVGLLAALLLVGCGSSRPSLFPRPLPPPSRVAEAPRADRVIPPWQTWSVDDAPEPLIRAAQLGAEGRVREEEEAYRAVEVQTPSPEIRREAFVRRMGAMLKAGRSKEVLAEVSRFSGTEGRRIEDLGPRLALVVAFAYENERDVDQTFAWLGMAHRQGNANREVGYRARSEAMRLIRKIRVDAFERYAKRWAGDAFINALFASERARRAEGGVPTNIPVPNWFTASTYAGPSETVSAPTSSLQPAQSGGKTIGVLLPLTGQFQKHAEKVRNGIELAFSEWQTASDPEGKTQLLVRDTGGDEHRTVAEYESLARDARAAAVLGPLLVRDTEAVAGSSKVLGVPFIAFTKKSGITALSPVAFRLGATADDQIREAVEYARKERQAFTFASVGSETSASREFLAGFRDIVTKAGGEVVAEVAVKAQEPASIEAAVSQLQQANPQAILFADTLDQSYPVIQLVRENSTLKGATLIGPASWDDPVFMRGYGTNLHGALFVTPFFARSDKGEVRNFSKLYEARFGSRPDLLSAQGYDAAKILLETLRSADSELSDALRRGKPHRGVTGEIRPRENGELERRMSVVEIRGGDAVEIFAAGVPTGSVALEPETNEGRKETTDSEALR